MNLINKPFIIKIDSTTEKEQKVFKALAKYHEYASVGACTRDLLEKEIKRVHKTDKKAWEAFVEHEIRVVCKACGCDKNHTPYAVQRAVEIFNTKSM